MVRPLGIAVVAAAGVWNSLLKVRRASAGSVHLVCERESRVMMKKSPAPLDRWYDLVVMYDSRRIGRSDTGVSEKVACGSLSWVYLCGTKRALRLDWVYTGVCDCSRICD